MSDSVFDLFKIGIGPSSSHTVGPMVAAARFIAERIGDRLSEVARVEVALFGSLALTGKGHAADRAIILGLAGEDPATIDPADIEAIESTVRGEKRLKLGGTQPIDFDPDRHIHWQMEKRLPFHSNAMEFRAFGEKGLINEETYYSVGGGFVVDMAEAGRNDTRPPPDERPHPFKSAADLLEIGEREDLSFCQIQMHNERSLRVEAEIKDGFDAIIDAMDGCIDRGMTNDGELPGGLKVKRRAPELYRKMQAKAERALVEPLSAMDWVNCWAIAVNEENAAGGRVVTAPTNGAAGIIPAVLRYYDRFCRSSREGKHTFLLTAAAIGTLYKRNASISGAEVGCQGEVGSACSMAAGGLTAALGGSNAQIENAAEIAMEHNLGLTCDPIAGLVQIPCIERNAMGAIKAIDASRLALLGDGTHSVSLDKVIDTMKRTGADMDEIYKETAKGGLAVNIVAC